MDGRHLSSFEAWLDTVRGISAPTIRSRISNCKRVEQFEGDLDSLFDNDGLASLLERLTYSTEDATYRRRPKHMVPINGDVRTGTATLKTAVTLYREFRNSSELGLGDRPRTRPVRQRAGGQRTESGSWPDWGQPTEETLRSLAQALTPLVRFLKPKLSPPSPRTRDGMRPSGHFVFANAALTQQSTCGTARRAYSPAYGVMPGARRSPSSDGSLPRKLLLPTALRSTTMIIRSTCGHSSSPASRFARRAPTATS